MSRIRGKNTKPEHVIRRGLFALGFRYRLHRRDLPGCPDLVLSKYRAVIFVNGCLWHGHNCHLFSWPRTRAEFWRRKIQGNRRRDRQARAALRTQQWRVMTVWECALRGRLRLGDAQLFLALARWVRSNQTEAQIVGSLRAQDSNARVVLQECLRLRTRQVAPA